MNRWLEFWAVRSLWELMHQLGIARIMGIHRDSMLSLIFYAWILAPQLKGAEKVYKWIVEPMMDKHGADVDEQIMRAKTHTKDIIEAWVLKFIQIARVGAAHILRQAHAAIANMDSQKS